MIETIGNAQMQYEDEEWEYLEKANEFLKEGHDRWCAAKMAKTGCECTCIPGDWLANRGEG